MPNTDWKSVAAEWRKLSPEEQRRIRLSRIPRKVARSMAFAGEPVDERMLEEELQRLIAQRQAARSGAHCDPASAPSADEKHIRKETRA